MRRYALILLLALSMAVLPLMGRAQDDSSAGSTTGSDAAASCAKIQMGAVTGGEESGEETGEATDDEALQDYYDYQDSAGSEQQTTEYNCNEQLNEDGTLTCFCGETPIVCTVEGEDVYCPECQNAQ
ncbi:MAG: hypothetical protein WC683_08800 [bacterium]